MSTIKSTSRTSSGISTQLETTTNSDKQADPSSVEQKQATPTAQETKSSQQLAHARKEELELSSLSSPLNRGLNAVSKFGERPVKESKHQDIQQPSMKSGTETFSATNLVQMGLLGNLGAETIQTGTKTKASGPKTFFTDEELFSMCEKGHEQPETIIDDPDEANKSVQKSYQEMISGTSSNHPKFIFEDSDQKSSLNSEGHDTASWLTEDFLGPTVHQRFSKTPPFFTTVPRKYFDLDKQVNGYDGDADAKYVPGTNHVLIASDLKNEADRRRLLVHEQLHYASNLGGGDPTNIRWRDENGQPVTGSKPYAVALHEGISELMAQQLTRGNGFETTEASYPQELRVAFLINKIVGDEAVMREAFLTGNFTEVRKKVDQKLPGTAGQSTFDLKKTILTRLCRCLNRLWMKQGSNITSGWKIHYSKSPDLDTCTRNKLASLRTNESWREQ